MYAVFNGETLVALKDEYEDARLVQLSTGNPLEFYVIKVESLAELQNVMANVAKVNELNLAH